LSYEPLPWDSQFFGFPIGRISAQATADTVAPAVAAADGEGIRCLYHLVAADDVAMLHAALRLGFEPYDIRLEFERELEPTAARDGATVVREAKPADERVLSELAAETITATRFAVDPHFPQDRVPLLYAAWVRRGLTSGPARCVLLAEPAAGFLVCGLATEDRVGSIELVGVAGRFARRGIGGSLLGEAHARMLEAGCERATVVTQGRNIGAQRLYQTSGYKTRSVAWWLHRWHQG
jgi:dTDP-4-amino-4,6-dideoxy-D-galactose acyltransferase